MKLLPLTMMFVFFPSWTCISGQIPGDQRSKTVLLGLYPVCCKLDWKAKKDLSVKIELCRKIWPESSSSKSTRETKTVPWASENDFSICQEELVRLQQV